MYNISFTLLLREVLKGSGFSVVSISLVDVMQCKEVSAITALTAHLQVSFSFPMDSATVPVAVVTFDPSLLLGGAKHHKNSTTAQEMFTVVTEGGEHKH